MKRQQSLKKGHNTDNECSQNWSGQPCENHS